MSWEPELEELARRHALARKLEAAEDLEARPAEIPAGGPKTCGPRP